jgi:curli biogenesis system outer membrane secretion channel CsgG
MKTTKHQILSGLSRGLTVGLLASAAQAQTGAGGAENGSIERCNRVLGTLAVAEPQSHMLSSLGRFSLGSPTTMLRMMAQESGCFTVVERGVAMQNIQQERALAGGGMLQQGANMGGGQLQAADFVMTPALQFSDSTGGIGGAAIGLLGRYGGGLGAAIGGLAGGLKFKEAETTLLLADVRSGIQVASAEGKASKMDFSLGGWGWGGMGWASAGGYSKTPEGKLLAASLLDNYNRIVLSVRDKPLLVQATSAASQFNAANSVQATPVGAASVATTAAPLARDVMPLPAMTGMFNGQLMGMDQGTIMIMVMPNGVMSGMGKSKQAPAGFTLSGILSPSGDFQLTGQSPAGMTTFTGKIHPTTSTVSGQWGLAGQGQTGVFMGQKQPH